MKTIAVLIFGIFTLSLYSCKDDSDKIDDPVGGETVTLSYDFEDDTEGWNAAIAEYPADEEDLYEFETDQTASPADEEDGALMLSASNPNGHLFMYVTKQITGLEPRTSYNVSYSMDVASTVEIDTTGVDADTTGVDDDTTGVVVNLNDTVVIKAGATSEEPATETTVNNILQLIGIDIGEPGIDGADLVVIASFPAEPTAEEIETQTVSTEDPISVVTNEDGEFWLLVGTESFGSRAEIYFTNIEVEIKR